MSVRLYYVSVNTVLYKIKGSHNFTDKFSILKLLFGEKIEE